MVSSSADWPSKSAAVPLYQGVKDYVLGRILKHAWAPGTRVPSEQELVSELGVSRMTANRALRELTAEGYLVRVQGVGTFVAEPKPQTELLELRNIADEIRGRGHAYSCDVLTHERKAPDRQTASMLGLRPGQKAFHSLVVHRENGLPVQLEDRYVNPDVVPGYLEADLHQTTATEFLVATIHADEIEHTVEAIMPDDRARKLLELDKAVPCLSLRRRTWSGGAVVTVAQLLYPGPRYRLTGRAENR